MAYSINYAGSFKKDYKRLKKRGLPIDKMEEAVSKLVETGSLPPEYSPHNLLVNTPGNGNVTSTGETAIG